jgi:hypothetical protein
MVTHKIIEDRDISLATAKRRRVRVLVPPDARIDSRDIRDLAIDFGHRVEAFHGRQDAIAVQFYTDILSPAILGSWDLCPGGRWEWAIDNPKKERQWVVHRGISGDTMMKIREVVRQAAERSSRRDGGNVDGR